MVPADFQPGTEKLRFYSYYDCKMVVGNCSLDLLGFTGQKTNSDMTELILKSGVYYNFSKEINLNIFKPYMIIAYCNIVKPTIFAQENLNILRVLTVPEGTDKNCYIVQEFQNKHYIELANTEVSEIEINFRSQDGELIEFTGDQNIILNLEFTNTE